MPMQKKVQYDKLTMFRQLARVCDRSWWTRPVVL